MPQIRRETFFSLPTSKKDDPKTRSTQETLSEEHSNTPAVSLGWDVPGPDVAEESAAFAYEDMTTMKDAPTPVKTPVPGTKKTVKLKAIIFDSNGDYGDPVEGEFSKLKICEQHGLQPRDMRKMDSVYSAGKSAAILVRDRSILINLLHIKALIKADMVILVDAPGSENYSELFLHELSMKLKFDSGTYEFRALETILLNTMATLHAEQKKLFSRVNQTLAELDNRIDEKELKGLLISRRKLDESSAKINAVREAISAILNVDEDLAALYLTDKAASKPRAIEDHMEAELLMEHYLNAADDMGAATRQLAQNIAGTQEIINIVLAARRNQLLHFELMANLSMACLAFPTLVAGLFGMNMPNGLETSVDSFWVVFSAMIVFAGGLWVMTLRKLWKLALEAGYKKVQGGVPLQGPLANGRRGILLK
ncbi:uncharacterized protein EV422DRAFT_569648 [Fimicolochytrium jonesii]|uniref:uncharacterized protein n=1 Tax=Fimicolochytrium jonesii TaxID=1396493 RepID=UPI0022FDFF2F|nr:uncharacterized protein EV422DRAFT_569648 [Fimicolochytrium jonesii]KAI8818599.1 hypothetical protein EV422DRAFT_569648 [Fimicolochytrium jonesii]